LLTFFEALRAQTGVIDMSEFQFETFGDFVPHSRRIAKVENFAAAAAKEVSMWSAIVVESGIVTVDSDNADSTAFSHEPKCVVDRSAR
jgi:hypothetical protein